MNETAQAWISRAEGVFKVAGFQDIFFKEIPNEYCGSNSGCGICAEHPWLLVATRVGIFKFGWRKNVLVLDWSRSTVSGQAEDLFKDENVTKSGRMIHCWGYAKAIEYLTVLYQKVA
jgi:hypothetical protein